jgi:REP element-mobilizing transposase RayT
MPRSPRYFPDSGTPSTPIEVTTRTLQGRFLLRPCPEVTSIVIGVVARAQERFGMTVNWLVAASNHAHLKLEPTSQKQLSSFMGYVNSPTRSEPAS